MKYRLAAFMIAALIIAAPPGRGQESPSPYFPLKVGSKWHYRVGDDQKVIVRVAKMEPLKIVRKQKDNKPGEEKVTGATLEIVSVNPKPLREQVVVLADGVYRVSVADKEVSPALCILKLPVKKGDTWQVDSTIGDVKVKGTFQTGEATVGEFKCVTSILQSEETGSEKIVLEYYFAPGVGIVKQHVRSGNIDSTMVLDKYEP
jgi:hypothetical protein